MFDKTLQVRLDKKTFPKKRVPTYLKSGTVEINMLQALLMLGNVTVPNGASIASPAIFWAWIRYFSALAPHSELRITTPFADLDPHVKTLLSDDFGVAVTTQWLSDCVGGFKQVVDGRRFILNYAHLLAHKSPPAKKTGPRKSPDFVVLDASGKWHVIECKGTQTSLRHSVGQLDRACEQKGAIEIQKNLKGTRLAAGLYVVSENSGKVSTISVQDPREEKPLILLEDAAVALRAARRVTSARCFGLAGLPQIAFEAAATPAEDARLRNLFNEEELARGSLSTPERVRSVTAELTATRQRFEADGDEYSGRRVSVDIPWPSTGYEPRRVTVQQGIRAKYVDALRKEKGPNVLESIEEIAQEAIGNEPIGFSKTEAGGRLRQGNFFIATINFD
jgi:hypothetical protein